MTTPTKNNTPDQDMATAAWIAVVRAYNECQTTLAARFAPLGVSLLEHEIVMNLLRTPGLTQRQLSERCFSAKSGISMLIARMEKDGMVQRQSLPKDQRAWSISLTEDGLVLASKLHAIQADVITQMTSPYAEDELGVLKRLMNQSSELLRDMRENLS